MIAAVLVDLDGCLGDTLQAMRSAYFDAADELGFEPTTAEFLELNGPTLREAAALLAARHGLRASTAVVHDLLESGADAAYARCGPMPGARRLLERAAAIGADVAVVTSGRSSRAHAWLAQVGLRDLVADVVGGDAVERGKPSPDVYLLALERLGVDAATTVAVEDSVAGAMAALAAGITTYVVGGAQLAGATSVGSLDDVAAMLIPG